MSPTGQNVLLGFIACGLAYVGALLGLLRAGWRNRLRRPPEDSSPNH